MSLHTPVEKFERFVMKSHLEDRDPDELQRFFLAEVDKFVALGSGETSSDMAEAYYVSGHSRMVA